MVGLAATPSGHGYWLASQDGGVFAFGDAAFRGAAAGSPLNQPVTGIAATPDGGGYWLAAADGGVFAYGDAPFAGSLGASALNARIVGIARSPSGGGYWLVGADGGVFALGDAPFLGSLAGHPLNAPVTAIAATPTGHGYWLAGADGGVFAFGDAPFLGSLAGHPLNAPVTAIAATPSGRGYRLSGADGGVFAFGDGGFAGGLAGQTLNRPIVGITSTPGGRGYWLVGADGGVFSFGDAPFSGSTGQFGVVADPNIAQPGALPPDIPSVYVPMYQAAARASGVNWLALASIHAQETAFSRSTKPGARSGVNFAGCCAGPMQFSIVNGAGQIDPVKSTWGGHKGAYAAIAAQRPAIYPLQAELLPSCPRGIHPCVYDDFDAIAAAAHYLRQSNAGADLGAALHAALARYGGNPRSTQAQTYAGVVLARAQGWAAYIQAHSVAGPAPAPPAGAPFAAPYQGALVVTQRFWVTNGREAHHPGVDLGSPSGTTLRAVGAGTVSLVQTPTQSGGYGYFTCVAHSARVQSCYAHQQLIMVRVGQVVAQGQPIGISDCTGRCFGSHLHFEIRVDNKRVCPAPYLGQPSAGWCDRAAPGFGATIASAARSAGRSTPRAPGLTPTGAVLVAVRARPNGLVVHCGAVAVGAENGALEISARHTSCSVARRVARLALRGTLARRTRFTALRFHCRARRLAGSRLGLARLRCRRGPATIVFLA